jgi:Peptidase A4 family
MKIKMPMRVSLLLALLAAICAATVAWLGGAGSAAAASTSVQSSDSQNWAGYVASGTSFSSVSGSWTVPTVTAGSSSDQGYSAVWVGLGGSGSSSSSLEQIGTGADYVNGQADYYAWYELLPAAQVRLNLPIHAGDRVSASVTVHGTSVRLALADATTGQSLDRTLQMSAPDTSSAEWIVEAPALQSAAGAQILPLADFSKVTFGGATATADGHTGGISDPSWSTTRVQLGSSSGDGSTDGSGFMVPGSQAGYAQSGAGATTSDLSGDGFSVSWQDGNSAQPTASVQPSQYPDGGSAYGSAGQEPGYAYGYGGGYPDWGDPYQYGGYGQ